MAYYTPTVGVITQIDTQTTGNTRTSGCTLFISVVTEDQGPVNILLPSTAYVLNGRPLQVGDRVTFFYDSQAPVPLIYPPQYQAAFIARTEPGENVMVAYFNERLLSSENPLQLNISPNTRVTTANGQRYVCGIGNNLLMVYYSATTRSIPPQTTPERIIVFC